MLIFVQIRLDIVLVGLLACIAANELAAQQLETTDLAIDVTVAPLNDAVPQRSLGQGIPVYQPAPGASAREQAAVFENPVGAISLRDAIALALLHSPNLASFAWETRAREAHILQAGRPPNPTVAIMTQDFGARRFVSGGDPLQEVIQPQTTVELSQLIELGGKRMARQNLASRDRDLAAWDYETARIDVLTSVTRAFIDVIRAQRLVALTEQTTSLIERVEQNVSARVTAGVVSPIEQTKANVSLASARLELRRVQRALEAGRERLAAHWGASEARFETAVGEFPENPKLPPLAELKMRIHDNPDLARWTAELSERRAALKVEESKRIPDLTVTAGYRRYTSIDSKAFVVGGSIALPIFNRNKGAIEEARSRLARTYEEQRAAEARVMTLLAEAYQSLSIAHEEIEGLRSGVLPGSEQAFQAVSEGYGLGKFQFLDVLDAQRTLIGAGGDYLRALSDYYKALAEIERLIGSPLDTNSSSKTP
jgi:outer membrane protein, heavy metal efflux system